MPSEADFECYEIEEMCDGAAKSYDCGTPMRRHKDILHSIGNKSKTNIMAFSCFETQGFISAIMYSE